MSAYVSWRVGDLGQVWLKTEFSRTRNLWMMIRCEAAGVQMCLILFV